jgi:hypothetical protein
MSPELETLDQLAGGDLPLTVIRGLFDDGERFIRSLLAMLDAGEVRLLAADGAEFARWQWREVLIAASSPAAPSGPRLAITKIGGRRMG